MVLRTFLLVLGSFAAVAAVAACAEQSVGSASQPKPLAEDERGSAGPGPPAAYYCVNIGYRTDGEMCVFPDGTSCEQWSFYWAKCGQEHSYCNTHGGTIASEQVDAGDGFSTTNAICTVNGKHCPEEDYYRSGTCN